MEIEQRFRDAYANDRVLNAYEQVERSGGEIAEALEENLKAAGYSQREVETADYGAEALKQQGLEPAPIGKLEAALEAARTGSRTWQQWISTEAGRSTEAINGGQLKITFDDAGALVGS